MLDTAHSMLTCGQPQDIMLKQKRGNQNDPMARVRIQVDARVMWKEIQLPGIVDTLISTRVSGNTHEKIFKGSSQQLPGGNNRDSRNTSHGKPCNHKRRKRVRVT